MLGEVEKDMLIGIWSNENDQGSAS